MLIKQDDDDLHYERGEEGAPTLRVLDKEGWVEINGIDSDLALMNLAVSLGRIVGDQKISNLSPSSRAAATSRSFSHHYGLGQFPMHSDTAFWQMPARYVVLRSRSPSDTPTLLLPSARLKRLLDASPVDTAIFRIRTTSGNSYGKAVFARDPIGIRFDPCYMKATNSHARELMDNLSFPNDDNIHRLTWTGTNALIIDNWRCLHARASVGELDRNRTLSRIYVMGSKQ